MNLARFRTSGSKADRDAGERLEIRCGFGDAEVAAEINRRIADLRRQEQVDQARRRAQELPDWFELYNRLEPEKTESSD